MKNTETVKYLNIMIESLGKKMGLFETLLLKTESQNECITGKNHEQANWAQFEVLMIEKESTIKAVDELDAGFEQVFERVKPELDRNKDEYIEEIKTLQENISALTDLGVKIAAREERNRQEVDRIMTAAKITGRTIKKLLQRLRTEEKRQSSMPASAQRQLQLLLRDVQLIQEEAMLTLINTTSAMSR